MLRVKVLLQPEESSVPMKCIPKELKQSAIPEGEIRRDKGW